MESLGNGYLLSTGVAKLVRWRPGATGDSVCQLTRVCLRMRPIEESLEKDGGCQETERDLMASVKQLNQPYLKQTYSQRLLIS